MKMQVDKIERVSPAQRQLTNSCFHTLHTQATRVKSILKNLDTKKSVGPDDTNSHFLKKKKKNFTCDNFVLLERKVIPKDLSSLTSTGISGDPHSLLHDRTLSVAVKGHHQDSSLHMHQCQKDQY